MDYRIPLAIVMTVIIIWVAYLALKDGEDVDYDDWYVH